MTAPRSAPAHDGIRLEREGDVVVATIDRSAWCTAADTGVCRTLEHALGLDAAAVVITGADGNFSVGDDITMFDFAGEDDAERFIVTAQRLFQRIEAIERPVIAAVDGYALAFGFELALACDAVLATPRARFGLPEITVGAAPSNAIGRAPGVIGRGWTRHLALEGRHWLSGEEAHVRGLVVELHEPGRLRHAAISLAGDFARNPHFARAKRVANLDSERALPPAALVVPPLVASREVRDSQARRARG